MQLNLRSGEKIRLDGKTLTFTTTNADLERCFIDPATGKHYQLLDQDLLDQYLNRRVQFNVQETSQPGKDLADTSFCAYPQKHKDEALRRKAYVDALIEANTPKPQALCWPAIISAVAEKIGDQRKPSYLTVRPWLKAYRLSGGDVRSLIPRHCRKGRKKTSRDDLREQKFLDALLETYGKDTTPSKAKAVRIIEQEYAEQILNPINSHWRCPSRRSLYRMLDLGNARALTQKRHGTRAAVAKFDHGGMTPEAYFPMEVVEIDHTPLNIQVVDLRYECLLGRPWLTVAIDRFTRMVVGLYIGFEPPSIYSVNQCIKNMILPKRWLRRLYPNLPEWEAYGVPVLIVCDNGREFLSKSFQNVAAALGTTIRLAPVGNPEYKGTVESFQKTINRAGLSGLPGRTGSNPKERGDYDAEGKACMSLDDLRAYLHHWLLAEYVWKRHSGINRVPGQVWRESVKNWKPRLPSRIEDLDIILSRQDEGTITKKGVLFKGIFYQSPELQELFQNHQKLRKVRILIDDGDLVAVHVIHSTTQEPLRVPARNQQYAAGLSLFHHLQIRKLNAHLNEIDEHCDAAVKARAEFHELVRRWILQDSSKNRKALARAMKGSSTQPAAERPLMGYTPTLAEALKLGEEMSGRDASSDTALDTERASTANMHNTHPNDIQDFDVDTL